MSNDSISSDIISSIKEYLSLYKRVDNYPTYDGYALLNQRGGMICERMLAIVLLRWGHEPFGAPIALICAKDEEISKLFPEQIRNYLLAIHNLQYPSPYPDYEAQRELAQAFFQAFFWFSIWFDNEIGADGAIIRVFEEYIFKNSEVLQGALVDNYPSIPDDKPRANRLTVVDALNQLNDLANIINARTERTEQTVNEISKQIKLLSNQITAYQSLVQRQLQLSGSKDEEEHIIQAFTEECIPRIVDNMKSCNEERAFELEKKKLILSLGEGAWNKMDESSKTFLISSKVMYNNLILLDDAIDYSGVCLLITKALELELRNRFFCGFIDYLNEAYNRDYSVYHTALIYQKKPRSIAHFSLGDLMYLFCVYENGNDSQAQKENNKRKVIEYSKARLFSKKSDEEIANILVDYAYSVDLIRNSYRNPSAHANQVKRATAEDCFNLIIDVEKLLKRMLDSFDV